MTLEFKDGKMIYSHMRLSGEEAMTVNLQVQYFVEKNKNSATFRSFEELLVALDYLVKHGLESIA